MITPRSTEPGKPTTGTTTHPPRRPQRKLPDRAPISIGQRHPGNQGLQPTDPARPPPPRHGPCAESGPKEPEHPQTPRQRPHPIPETARRPRQPSIVGQRMPKCPRPSALGVKTCPQVGEAASSGEKQRYPPSETAQAGQRTACLRPRPSHHINQIRKIIIIKNEINKHTPTHTRTSHTSAHVPPPSTPLGFGAAGTSGGQQPPSHHRPPVTTDPEPAEQLLLPGARRERGMGI